MHRPMTVGEFLQTPPSVHACEPGGQYCLWGELIDGHPWDQSIQCTTHGTVRAPVQGDRVTGWHPGAPADYIVGYKAAQKAERTAHKARRAKDPVNMSMEYYLGADRYRL